MSIQDTRARLQALRKLLESEKASTQEELREELEKLDFEVTQSTISRDLRRLGAIKMTDSQGQTTYRLALDMPTTPFAEKLADLVTRVEHNGAMIVLHTTPGSASLVARHIDHLRSDQILGTIAGDDTIFVAPASIKNITKVIAYLQDSF